MTLEQWFIAAQQNDVGFLREHVGEFAGRRDELFGGKTALMYAAQNNRLDAARLLYPHEKALQSQNGSTALHLAAARGHGQIIALLAGAEGHIKNEKGKTPREVAQEKGHCLDVLRMFDAEVPQSPLACSRQLNSPRPNYSRDPYFDQQRQISSLLQTQKRLQLRLREEKLRKQQLLEKARQVEGDMRRDLDIADDTKVIAERVSSERDDHRLLQGEIEALGQEVEALRGAAAKLCNYVTARGSAVCDGSQLPV